ncbi:MAG TPA: metallophosphoesterase [Rhodocyclaceae bacterium]|nr:metallophosphoesterase [Rhodocyclaceae bacterium]
MRRLFSPFLLTITAILAAGYTYGAWRVTSTWSQRCLLAIPFAMVWMVPAVYWAHGREDNSRWDELLHASGYLCMGWLNFFIIVLLVRDLLLAATAGLVDAPRLHGLLVEGGAQLVFLTSFGALGIGFLAALRGPHVRHVQIPIKGLDPRLDGLRIAQISDLHVGPTIGTHYVRRVVALANRLAPDLIALTGDIVDGSVEGLAHQVSPLAELAPKERAFLVLGNHDYYSGAAAWVAQFRGLGLRVLLNEHAEIDHGGARIIVGGVTDPAARLFRDSQEPRPDLASAPDLGPAFRLLLAHNPKLAPLAEKAGFDLQLSGHTHAGQFFPWTLVVRWVHAPHVAGLSRQGRLKVYVNAGTGTWGPPVRFGTEPELTLLQLVAVP